MISDYARASSLAYRTLMRRGIRAFPVDPMSILSVCKRTKIVTYAQLARINGVGYTDILDAAPSEQAYTVVALAKGGPRYVVCVNTGALEYESVMRFTLAHELGHIVLRHTGDSEAAEREANCFARVLLCPPPVTKRLLLDESAASRFFGVSRACARVAVKTLPRDIAALSPEMCAMLDAHFGFECADRPNLVCDRRAIKLPDARKRESAPPARASFEAFEERYYDGMLARYDENAPI